MKKLSVDELLRLACIYAERDQEGFIDAMSNITPDKPNQPEDDANEAAIRDAEAFVKQIRAYRHKRWGRVKSDTLREIHEQAKPITVQEVVKRGDGVFTVLGVEIGENGRGEYCAVTLPHGTDLRVGDVMLGPKR